jgi:hypothetical protein
VKAKKQPVAVAPIPPRDFPSISAVAGATQTFGSGQEAFHEGQTVVLQFTPQTVVVHSATKPSPCSFTKLGIILYTYVFSAHEPYSVAKAEQTGQVSSKMYFLLRKIVHTKKRSECLFCGKVFMPALSALQATKHLTLHKS